MSNRPIFERSFRKSRTRARLLLALERLGGVAYAAELAREAHVDGQRVRAAMRGRDREFRADLSLVGLALVALRPTKTGTTYVLTSRGRAQLRVARRILAR